MSAVLQSQLSLSERERQADNIANAVIGMLDNQGPVSMEVPGLSAIDIAAAFEGLENFELKPRAEQARWQIHELRDAKYDEPDDGAIRKEPPHDWKLFFHYRRDLKRLLFERSGVRLTSVEEQWFEHMDAIHRTCTAANHAIAAALDRLCPGYRCIERALQFESTNVLRILRYVPHPGTLAKWHTDRAGITFHMAESHPGLRTARGHREREEHTPATPDVLVFSGDQLDTITRGEIQRCWHTVVDTTGGAAARQAMVFFGKFWPGAL
jgi:isopenicillin N synthase-like dioxygenase